MSLRDQFFHVGDVIVSVFGMLAILSVIYLAAQQSRGRDAQGVVALEEYDTTLPVACTSQSMGLVVRCEDTLLLRHVPSTGRLVEGRIYVYATNRTRSVVHRYVTCESNCTRLVMKGDNNRHAEKINRSQVQWEVVGAYYATGTQD